MTGVSAVAFTILGDAAAEFNVNVDAAGSGVGERDNGSRSIGGWNHNLDGGGGNDAFYGNYGWIGQR